MMRSPSSRIFCDGDDDRRVYPHSKEQWTNEKSKRGKLYYYNSRPNNETSIDEVRRETNQPNEKKTHNPKSSYLAIYHIKPLRFYFTSTHKKINTNKTTRQKVHLLNLRSSF